ncbi:MAG: pilus assembly FimT family protein [Planctomycetota bacterium]|jgi:hypothetical protein
MKAKFKQSGLTLTETVVVIASIAILISLGLPAVRALTTSFQSQAGTRSMISAALASARAIAAKEQHYAGIRFQKAYYPEGLQKAPQYIIFIVHDFDKTGLENGFRAVEGIEPIKLPYSVGVMDLMHRTNYSDPEDSAGSAIEFDNEIDNPEELRDTTAFSIIFSPSGKLVIHEVRIRNRNGQTNDTSEDDIFNTKDNVEDKKIAMFYQDDYAENGLGQELSRNRFIIYDRNQFESLDRNRRWTDYLSNLDPIYINPYTGRMISK